MRGAVPLRCSRACEYLQYVGVQMDAIFSHQIFLGEMQASALIAAEFYQKAGQWKVRALAETSAYGLAALGLSLIHI